MKKLYTTVLFLALISHLLADINVKSFRKLENDVDARVGTTSLKDQNGDVSAIIKVVTTETGFTFDCGSIGIVKTVNKPSEIWVYVPYGAKRISIMHPQLGQLRDWFFTQPIEKATVYELILTMGKVTVKVEENEIETQWLLINTDPTGADVYIDDQPAGKTPCQSEFPVGSHTWRIQKELYKNESGVVDLLSGGDKQKINLKLKPNFGSIQVKSLPNDGASVNLDGIPTGKKTPCNLETVPAGEHAITVSMDMYETATQRVTLLSGETKPVSISMNSTFGEVSITTDPKADIYVNGQFKGNDTWQGRLSPGIFTFEAKLDKYTPAYERQNIVVGQPLTIALHPTPRTGGLKIISMPYEATISIAGKTMGQTPKTIKNLLIGDYDVELSLPGYATVIEKTTVVEGQTAMVNATLVNGRPVKINSQQSGSSLYIDGNLIGVTPFNGNLTFGTHVLRIENGGKKAERTVNIYQTGETPNFSMNFNIADVNISSSPSEADVYVDEKFIGKTPLKSELTFGMHSLRMIKGDKSSSQQITFTSESSSELFAELYECNSQKIVNSRPTGALVLVNDQELGTTPLSYNMVNKEDALVLKKDGYQTFRETLYCNGSNFTADLIAKKQFKLGDYLSLGIPIEWGYRPDNEAFSIGTGLGLNVKLFNWLFIQNTLNFDYSMDDNIYLTRNHSVCLGIPLDADKNLLYAEYGLGYDVINTNTTKFNIYGLGYGNYQYNLGVRVKEFNSIELYLRFGLFSRSNENYSKVGLITGLLGEVGALVSILTGLQ